MKLFYANVSKTLFGKGVIAVQLHIIPAFLPRHHIFFNMAAKSVSLTHPSLSFSSIEI